MNEALDIGGLLTIYDNNENVLLRATAFSSVGHADDFASDYFAAHPNAQRALFSPHTYQLRGRIDEFSIASR